ncbi:MAG: helix-turn-helix transcriptional regulator [Paucibacter sp.]|nr:helix-turn-helix transcriptional regulator [Roseateles sp.]
MTIAPHEPRLARIAAAIADPARSRMLAYLLGGEYASAGELARAASVAPATASGHLRKLLDNGLVDCEQRGRHRYFRLGGPEVAHALEALALVAERGTHERVWVAPERLRLREARCCWGHLAGRLGVRLHDTLQSRQGLRAVSGGFELTPAGSDWLGAMGLQAPAPSTQRRYAYACLDWSERRDHLAGQLAEAILAHWLARDWVRRGAGRAVELTPLGARELVPQLA